jgi:hypothetical protein
MSMEKPENLVPGRLAIRIEEGLRGHHPLFEPGEIREAFAIEDRPVTRGEADAVGAALLAICESPLDAARFVVDGLALGARLALIRLYFRLLDRAQEDRGGRH